MESRELKKDEKRSGAWEGGKTQSRARRGDADGPGGEKKKERNGVKTQGKRKTRMGGNGENNRWTESAGS